MVADPQPLSLLPDPDKGDLFFDFEGDPLWTADGQEWGLEYLWGVLEAGGKFGPLWAHDRAGERKALVDFLELVRKRRKRHPNMHIYHYAAYEKSALLRLAGYHGVGEDEVDDLLRSGILVDLFPLVRKSIQIGADNYSLKSLEPLYMGAELRSGDVTTAAESITQYAHYGELVADGRSEEAALVLNDIEDYNRYDCRSTQRLRDWLIKIAFECSVPPLGPQPVADASAAEECDDLADSLAAFVGDDFDNRSAEQAAVALIAAARGYHRREDKPFWWGHFDRLNNPVDEWGDTSDVFIAESATVTTDWHLPPRARKPQRRVKMTGTLAAGGLSGQMFALYHPPTPPALSDNADRRGAANAEVMHFNDPTVPTEVTICERVGAGDQYDPTPFALTPGRPIPTTKLRASIDTVAAGIAAGLPNLPDTAVVDILLRRRPRTHSGAPLPHTGDATSDIANALQDLDHSYVAVHGPPGTGKTYTAARVIAALVNNRQWRIGVVAQSHAVVENLFRELIEAGVAPTQIAKKAHGPDATWQVIDDKAYPDFISCHAGCVIGGTAWDFAHDVRVPQGCCDLLVIEEAGQFCLANTIAVARAAENLMLLGDPQQLPQVSQGHHPEPVDASALGWLVGEHRTLPDAFGYFLDRSYRMHPAVCAPVSRLSYEGRLHSDEQRTTSRRLEGHPPGVRVVTVDHDGNATSSPEEADTIVSEIKQLVGAKWTDENGSRDLDDSDVLVVAPYNAQVLLLRERLDEAGLSDVAVGTVDKFQGRQAPVVFVSMTASSIDDVPRGISFLLNRNRLNVAISRAKYSSILVRSKALTDYLPSTPDRLIDLGAFLTLSPCDTPSE